ncbi:hypothetical protein B0H10DRAFT_884041 [Mycena sp. CBHHK59/15]|nr:hypothetical protein B0H10DRAFT_884041 [Mycena sp. CBHHK59/15]
MRHTELAATSPTRREVCLWIGGRVGVSGMQKTRCRSRAAPTYTTTSHPWPPDARASRQVRPLHLCRAAHPGAAACSRTRHMGEIGCDSPQCSDPCRCEDEDEDEVRPTRLRVTKKGAMFYAIAVVSAPLNTQAFGPPSLTSQHIVPDSDCDLRKSYQYYQASHPRPSLPPIRFTPDVCVSHTPSRLRPLPSQPMHRAAAEARPPARRAVLLGHGSRAGVGGTQKRDADPYRPPPRHPAFRLDTDTRETSDVHSPSWRLLACPRLAAARAHSVGMN